jgi:PBP1b-binding outer membrane lipoprotein LpoB
VKKIIGIIIILIIILTGCSSAKSGNDIKDKQTNNDNQKISNNIKDTKSNTNSSLLENIDTTKNLFEK